MKTHLSFVATCAAAFMFCAAAMPAVARADTDACTLLTPAEVGAAVGVAVGAGALLFVLGHGVDALLVLAGGILSWIATML